MPQHVDLDLDLGLGLDLDLDPLSMFQKVPLVPCVYHRPPIRGSGFIPAEGCADPGPPAPPTALRRSSLREGGGSPAQPDPSEHSLNEALVPPLPC